MKITLYYPVDSYQLDFGIIPGTEQIYINGRLLSPNEYYLIHSIGELIFYNSSLINENDNIEAYYEYKPFFAGSQKISLASRFDWKPSNLLNIGGTIIYNISQREGGAPSIFFTPSASFLANIDGGINISRLLNLPKDFEFLIKGEYALSSLDRNTYGYAIIDDFENSGEIIRYLKNENVWILCAPTKLIENISYSNRGKLLYKDYRNYNLDGTFTLLNYSSKIDNEKIKKYSFKPGPYLALGGHLPSQIYPNVVQSSIIFDYDFRDGGEWIGAAFNIAGPSGIDISQYNQITIWLKLESDNNYDEIFEDDPNHSIDLFLAVGQFNEDSDGDGVFDFEIDRAQSGYEFNNYLTNKIIETYIGRGRAGLGDNYIQTEDLNKNNVFETNENILIFPSKLGYTDITNLNIKGTNWQKININIRFLTENQIKILQHVSAMGIYIRKNNGLKGRLIVDSIDFKKVNWVDKKVDDIIINDSEVIKGEVFSVFNNNFYSANRFYTLQSSDSNDVDRALMFERLHGQKTYSESMQLDEKSLGIYYNLSNISINTNIFPPTGGMKASLIKRSSYPIDFSYYKYLTFYLFIPEKDENGIPYKNSIDTYDNEIFTLFLKNTEKNFYKFKIPLKNLQLNKWNEIKINILNNLNVEINGNNITNINNEIKYLDVIGYPTLNNINSIEIGIEAINTNEPYNNGLILINEMYTSMDDPVIGGVYYITSSLNYKKPILQLWNYELIGPITINSTIENKDYNFVPSEGSKRDNYFNNFNISLNSSLLKYLSYNFSFNMNNSGTSTNLLELPLYLQWNNLNNSLNWSILFDLKRDYVPSFTHSYTENYESRINRNLVVETLYDYVSIFKATKYNNALTYNINSRIPILKEFIVVPSLNFSDFYEIFDSSNYTNEINPYYLTNVSVYGMENLKKSLDTTIRFYIWKLNLSGSFKKEQENYIRITDYNGFRQKIYDLNNFNLFYRYFERINSSLMGFYFEYTPFLKNYLESYSLDFSLDRPIPYFSVSINDSLVKSISGIEYDLLGNLSSRTGKYNLGNDWTLNIYPKILYFDTLSFKIARNIDLSYYSLEKEIDITNILINVMEIFYQHPLYYNGLFFGNEGRSNSLILTSHFSESVYSSLFSFSDKFNIEILISQIQGFFGNLIPKRYKFSTALFSERKINSYYQRMETYFETSFSVKFKELNLDYFKEKSGNRIGDLNINLRFNNNINFNDRSANNILIVGANHSIFFNNDLYSINYSYDLGYNLNSFLTNTENFEYNFGLNLPPPNISPKHIINHTFNFTYNWTIKDFKELNLWFFVINLRGSNLNNRENISFSADNIIIDGNNFSRFLQKIYEITFEHNSSYSFTDYVTGSFILKSVLNNYAEVSPLGNNKKISYFKPGFGILGSIEVRIKF